MASLVGLAAVVLHAGGLLLQLFAILSGAVNGSPMNQFYFLEASTTGIPNARNPSRWTFFAMCGVDDRGHNSNCGSPVPALPFYPPRNFGTDVNVPKGFIGIEQYYYYYYMSRFSFAFYLIALFVAAAALLIGLLALCSGVGGYLSALTTAVALFFQTLAAALMTAWIVAGRDAFRSAGFESNVGVKLIAFTWAAAACFLISSALFCWPFRRKVVHWATTPKPPLPRMTNPEEIWLQPFPM